LLRNSLQQQKPVRNHTSAAATKCATNMALRDADDDDCLMLFKLLECYYQALLSISVTKKLISANEAIGLVDG